VAAERKKTELTSLTKQLRSVEAKLTAETEACSQYIKELKLMHKRASEALKDVLGLHMSQICEMKSPADLIARTMDVVLILLYACLDKATMVEVKGRKQLKDSWPTVVKLVQEGFNGMTFLSAMRKVDPESVTREQMELVQPYLSAEDFTVERVRMFAGGICVPIMKWILFMTDYARRKQECAPFLSDYFRMQDRFRTLSTVVSRAKDALEEQRTQTDSLRKQYDDAVARRQSLETADDRKQANIKSAEEMLTGLRHQQQRWTYILREYHSDLFKLAGGCSMAAAFLTYCGPLNSMYREKVVEEVLMPSCRDNGVKVKVVPRLCDRMYVSM
jgi:dynein heavy chain